MAQKIHLRSCRICKPRIIQGRTLARATWAPYARALNEDRLRLQQPDDVRDFGAEDLSAIRYVGGVRNIHVPQSPRICGEQVGFDARKPPARTIFSAPTGNISLGSERHLRERISYGQFGAVRGVVLANIWKLSRRVTSMAYVFSSSEYADWSFSGAVRGVGEQ